MRIDENGYWKWPKTGLVCSENAAFGGFKYLFFSIEYAEGNWKALIKKSY